MPWQAEASREDQSQPPRSARVLGVQVDVPQQRRVRTLRSVLRQIRRDCRERREVSEELEDEWRTAARWTHVLLRDNHAVLSQSKGVVAVL